MFRTLLMAIAAVAGLALLLGAAPALACDGMPNCTCNHGKDAKAKGASAKKKAGKDEKKSVTNPPPAQTAPVKEGSLLDEIDQIMAAKCDCTGPSDCTCKKGQCKCTKCGNRHPSMFETLKGTPDLLKVPQNARGDATGGIFI